MDAANVTGAVCTFARRIDKEASLQADIDSRAATADVELPEGRPRTPLDLAAAKLRTALQERSGYVIVTAESAAAAEALFTAVEPRLRTFRTVRSSGHGLDPEAIVRALWRDGEAPFPARLAMRALIEEARSVSQPIVVAITDADVADPACLERVRLTLEGAPDASEIVHIALLGGPGLIELLRRPETRAVAMRIGATVQVPTVTAELATTAQRAAGRRTRSALRPALVAGGLVVVGLVALLVVRSAPRIGGVAAPARPSVAAPVVSPPARPVAAPTHPPTAAPVAAPAPAAPVPAPVAAAPPVGVVTDTGPMAPEPAVEPTPLGEADARSSNAPAQTDTAAPKEEAPDRPSPPSDWEPLPPNHAPEETTATAPPAAAPSRAGRGTALQVAAFVHPEGAEALRARLAMQFRHVVVSPAKRGGTTYHRVRIDGFANAAALEAAERWLRAEGHAPARVPE
jgi:hypothetical protein